MVKLLRAPTVSLPSRSKEIQRGLKHTTQRQENADGPRERIYHLLFITFRGINPISKGNYRDTQPVGDSLAKHIYTIYNQGRFYH